MKHRVFVLGLDGFPFSYLNNSYIRNAMPHFYSLCVKYGLNKMESVYPVVSSVAWTSFATGSNPGEHNIFGFTTPQNPFKISITTSKHRGKKAIWETLNTNYKKVVINVPITYPPSRINGYMISCFLCTDINKSSYPIDLANCLKNKNYIIDADASLVKEKPIEFLKQLIEIIDKRFEITDQLLKEDWDYFHLHIMETDRLLHFFIDYILNEKSDDASKLVDLFFKRLDRYIFSLVNKLISYSSIIILSDHGFCSIKSEVQLNRWLEINKYLSFCPSDRSLEKFSSKTICYALTPGRIYFNSTYKKKNLPFETYSDIREEIKQKLIEWTHPISGEKIVEKVFFTEEIYQGNYVENAPDIIVHPKNGYDFKSDIVEDLFTKSNLKGMHTYNDALVLGINIDVSHVKKIEEVYYIIKHYVENEFV